MVEVNFNRKKKKVQRGMEVNENGEKKRENVKGE